MRSIATIAASFICAVTVAAQTPPPAQQQPPPAGQQAGAPAGQRQGGGGGGGGRGRAIQVLTLSTTAWVDGGVIPTKYSQAGEEVSPALTWTPVDDAPPAVATPTPAPAAAPAAAAGGRGQAAPPNPVKSYVLIVHDIDSMSPDLASDTLHWMVWNIPATSRGLPEHVPQGADLADGSRQISVTGPYYRGPAAPANGPMHHYVFDLYALDAMIDVPAVGAAVPATRAAVMAAMATHVRGKATMVGRFRYAAAAK